MARSMFTGFGVKDSQAPRKVHIFSEHSVYPVVKAETLLSSIQREKIINDIKMLAEAPQAHYAALYKALFDNFAEFVQILPVNNEARLCSILDEGLLRALFVLQAFLGKRGEGGVEPIMVYVMFSAGLLFDLGSILEDRSVVISDRDGTFVKQWYPHEGAMRVTDGYYKIRRGGGYPPWLGRRATPLLARQVMPEIGYAWIAKDARAFDIWIALLNYEREGAGEFTIYFDRALEMLEEFKTQQDFYAKFPINAEEISPKETELGEDFVQWLREAIEKGELSINRNDSDIHRIEEGLFVNIVDLFERFIKVSAGSKTLYAEIDLAEMINQLSKLGMTNGVVKEYFLRRSVIAARIGLGSVTSSLFQGTKATAAATAEDRVSLSHAAEKDSRTEHALEKGASLSGVVIGALAQTFMPTVGENARVGINANLQSVGVAPAVERYPHLTTTQEPQQNVVQEAKYAA